MTLNNLSLIIAAAAAVGACSPLAPSVSKLSNAAAHPTDSSSPSTGLSGLATLGKNSSSASKLDELPIQTTEVAQQKDFDHRVKNHSNNFKVLRLEDKRVINDFIGKGVATFGSSDEILGDEAKLIRKSTKICLVLNTSLDLTGHPEIAELKASLSWHPSSSPDEEGHWELKCDRLSKDNSDPVSDIAIGEIRDSLRQHLVKLGFEFQSE